jgi:hypothetical protein
LAHLEEHLSLIPGKAPSELLNRGLRASGLSEKTFAHILSGLLFAQVFKECSEEEQQDARWLPVIHRIVPRFTESLAALMGHMEGRADSRVVRRMLRRPNKLARIVNHGLLGRSKTRRDREIRQAMGALSAEPNPLGDLYEGFDVAAQSAGTSREDRVASSELEEGEAGDREMKRVIVGLLLLLGSPFVLALGIVLGVSAGTSVAMGVAVAICLGAAVMAIVGVVLILQVIIWLVREGREAEPDEMSDTDVLLTADVEDLLAA